MLYHPVSDERVIDNLVQQSNEYAAGLASTRALPQLPCHRPEQAPTAYTRTHPSQSRPMSHEGNAFPAIKAEVARPRKAGIDLQRAKHYDN